MGNKVSWGGYNPTPELQIKHGLRWSCWNFGMNEERDKLKKKNSFEDRLILS